MLSQLPKPRLVLRVGVAGAIRVADHQRTHLDGLFTEVYRVIAARLEALSPGLGPSPRPGICDYYASEDEAGRVRPVMRVVSGLADGADQIAFQSLLAFERDARATLSQPGAHTMFELVAILPCDAASFRDNSAVEHTRTFDALLERCVYTIELDGRCAPRTPPHAAADRLTAERRNRAFRVQSAVLLRQCDVLIAAADLDGTAGAGGTRETMRAAVGLGIPVICLSIAPEHGDARVSVITRPVDLEGEGDASPGPWAASVEEAVTRILADPRR